jgi:hypothetical protein
MFLLTTDYCLVMLFFGIPVHHGYDRLKGREALFGAGKSLVSEKRAGQISGMRRSVRIIPFILKYSGSYYH